MKERFKDYPNPDVVELIRTCDALQILYDFHALRYPAVHQQAVSPEGFAYPEHLMTRSDITTTSKANGIIQLMRSFAGHIIQLPEPARAEALIDYCQERLLPVDYETLHDPAGEPMTAAELLPPVPVLNAMLHTVSLDRTMPCRGLEQFIDAQLSAAS